MKFYGRLTPGIVTDLDTPLELVLHQPRQATSGVVVKIWEKASYTDIDGRFVEEGGADDLLLELHGDVSADDASRKRGRSKLVVKRVVVPTREAVTPLGVLRLRVNGDPTIHEAPIPSTEAELGGQNFEMSLTIEHDGTEVFKSKVTTFIRPALANPRINATRLLGFDDDGEPIRDPDDEILLAGQYATIGTSSVPDTSGRLVVLGVAIITEDGRLAPCDGDGQPVEGELMLLRTHRDLFAYLTPKLPKAAKTIGESAISIALCHAIEPDGTIALDVPRPLSRGHYHAVDHDDEAP